MELSVSLNYTLKLIKRNAGYVFEAIDDNRKQRVALKRTQKAGNVVSREYEILSLLKGSPNVI